MGNPIEVLQNEHNLLKHAISTTQKLQDIKDPDQYRFLMEKSVLFFRNFTELYHHPKEEVMMHYVINSGRSMMSRDQLEQLVRHNEDIDLLIADVIDALYGYNERQLRHLVAQYTEELGRQIEEEEKVLNNEGHPYFTELESEMIYNEFLHYNSKDRLLDAIKNNYYKISNELILN